MKIYCIIALQLLISIHLALCLNQTKSYFRGQKLDHFSVIDNRVFTQKYYYSKQFWDQKDGPIFLYISGEAPCSGLPTNYFLNYSQTFNALMVTLEHRYYGESQPFSELTTQNLQYLSSKQAIEDLDYFIHYFTNTYLGGSLSRSKWFTIGCSYAGALSAWFRLKHPEATIGSLSSSGVINAVLDFYEFDEQVAAAVGSECAKALQLTTKSVESMMATNSTKVKSMFKVDYWDDDGNGNFYYLLANIGAESVQYGFQNLLCQTMANVTNGAWVEAFANFAVSFFYPTFGPPFEQSTNFLVQTFTPNAGRAFWYQQCTELGYFQTAPVLDSIRSHAVNLTWYRNYCKKLFGADLWPDTEATNDYYGATRIAGTKIYFANSSQDPWKAASVLATVHPDAEPSRLVICGDCGHCSDLRGCPSLDDDFNLNGCENMKNVNATREQITALMDLWLNSP